MILCELINFSRVLLTFPLYYYSFFSPSLSSSDLLFHRFCSRWQIHQWLFFQQDSLFKPSPYSPEMIVRSNIIRLKSFSGCHSFFGLLFCVCVYGCVSIFFLLSLCVACHFRVAHFFCTLQQEILFLPNEIVSLEPFQKFNWIPYTYVYISTVRASWVCIGFSRDFTEIRLSIHILR